MNIFVLDRNPVLAAQQQCNKHVVKMVLESAQMLCLAFPKGTTPYKNTNHFNHPCSIWVRKSRANFNWLIEHGLALCKEYESRYGKIHKSQAVIEWCKENSHTLSFPSEGLTEFAQAMPDECRRTDPVEAYRTYYIMHKRNFAKWPDNKKPAWYT